MTHVCIFKGVSTARAIDKKLVISNYIEELKASFCVQHCINFIVTSTELFGAFVF